MQRRIGGAILVLYVIGALGKKFSHLPLQRLSLSSTIPAGGSVWPLAIYWCFIEVGTPPQRFPVAIDSGSGFIAIPGKDCDGCASSVPNNAYRAEESFTSNLVRAVDTSPTKYGWVDHPDNRSGLNSDFTLSYTTCDLHRPTAPCSIKGSLYQDVVSIAGFGPVVTTFGKITKQTRNFDQFAGIDGVLGLLPPMPAEWGAKSKGNLFANLVDGGFCDNVWALCLHQGSVSTGSLTLGGVDTRLVDGPITYVKNIGLGLEGRDEFAVHVNSVKFGETVFKVGHMAVLDSGTNILLLPSQLRNAVKEWMCADSSLPFVQDLWNHTCRAMTLEQIDAYPHIKIELDGVVLEMSPRDYILLGSPLAKSSDQYCIGIRDGGESPHGFMLGDTTYRNYYVVHDIGSGRIGWGKVNRQMCGSVGEPDADDFAQMVEESPAQFAVLMVSACVFGLATISAIVWAHSTKGDVQDLGGRYFSIE